MCRNGTNCLCLIWQPHAGLHLSHFRTCLTFTSSQVLVLYSSEERKGRFVGFWRENGADESAPNIQSEPKLLLSLWVMKLNLLVVQVGCILLCQCDTCFPSNVFIFCDLLLFSIKPSPRSATAVRMALPGRTIWSEPAHISHWNIVFPESIWVLWQHFQFAPLRVYYHPSGPSEQHEYNQGRSLIWFST